MKRGGAPAGRLPVARYLVALPAAALAFMALAILDQRQTFFSAWGFIQPPGVAPPAANSTLGSQRALEAVKRFNRTIERAYKDGSTQALLEIPLDASLRARLGEEFAYLPALSRAAGFSLANFEVISVEPSGRGGWQVTTEETWAAPKATRRDRLRFRYALAETDDGVRIDDITPILPEPVRAPRD